MSAVKGRRSSSPGARRVVRFADRRKRALGLIKVGAVAALRMLAAGALAAAVAVGMIRAYQWATTDDTLALRAIRFEGIKHAAEADLLARSGLVLGQNIFRADLAKAARGLSQHPWVASARLSRKLPGEIVVQVREHEAQALVELGALYASDAAGRLFKRATRADELDLPLLTGLLRDDFKAQKPQAQRGLALSLALLDQWRLSGLPASQLSEVRVDADGGLTLFAHSGSLLEVRIGDEKFGERLRRLSQIRSALARRNERAVKVQLDLVKAGGASWATAQIATTE